MTTQSAVFGAVESALSAAGLHVQEGPARDLPTVDGLVGQAVVLWPTAGLHTYSRVTGTRSGRTDRLRLTCVGATGRDALAVADKVEAAIGGLRLSARGGTLRQVLASDPTPEPNSDPQRVSLLLEYTTITKE